jgi:hypothetical protein
MTIRKSQASLATALIAAFGLMVPAASATDYVELGPGHIKIVKPIRQVQGIAIGNPAIADARPVNVSTIAITGRQVGTTDVVMLDDQGNEISQIIVHVVAGWDWRGGKKLDPRHYVRVRFPSPSNTNRNSGVTHSPAMGLDRIYLCASQNCSQIPVSDKGALAPGTSSGSTSQLFIQTEGNSLASMTRIEP